VADRVPLSQVRVGSTLLLPCRMTAKGPAGVTLEAVDEAMVTTGTFSITLAGVVSGQWVGDPRDQPVKVMAFGLSPGDVVREVATGVTAVVVATNVNGRPDRWSPAASGQPNFTTAGWEPIGTVTLP
jgi:hypothetical protein